MNPDIERHHVQQAAKTIREFIENEWVMREKVFKHYPTRRAAKLAECNRALEALDRLLEYLYAARPDLRPGPEPSVEQLALFEGERLGGG